ncbi:uncharacterized [Tachysurus ichikawai]
MITTRAASSSLSLAVPTAASRLCALLPTHPRYLGTGAAYYLPSEGGVPFRKTLHVFPRETHTSTHAGFLKGLSLLGLS